jgi:hypothetical protein
MTEELHSLDDTSWKYYLLGGAAVCVTVAVGVGVVYYKRSTRRNKSQILADQGDLKGLMRLGRNLEQTNQLIEAFECYFR